MIHWRSQPPWHVAASLKHLSFWNHSGDTPMLATSIHEKTFRWMRENRRLRYAHIHHETIATRCRFVAEPNRRKKMFFFQPLSNLALKNILNRIFSYGEKWSSLFFFYQTINRCKENSSSINDTRLQLENVLNHASYVIGSHIKRDVGT